MEDPKSLELHASAYYEHGSDIASNENEGSTPL